MNDDTNIKATPAELNRAARHAHLRTAVIDAARAALRAEGAALRTAAELEKSRFGGDLRRHYDATADHGVSLTMGAGAFLALDSALSALAAFEAESNTP